VADSQEVRRLTDLPFSITTRPLGNLTPAGARLFFAACEPGVGCEPWISDGSVQGTRRIADIATGDASSIPINFGNSTTAALVGSAVLFNAWDGVAQRSWRTDGTAGGTTQIGPAFDFSVGSTPTAHGPVFLSSQPGSAGLWVTDGSETGTRLLKGVESLHHSSGFRLGLISNGETAIFSLETEEHGVEPWRSDGTPEGTYLLADLCVGDCNTQFQRAVASASGTIYFVARRPGESWQVWQTDGSTQGTKAVITNLAESATVESLFETESGTQLIQLKDDAGESLLAYSGTGLGADLLPDETEPVSSFPKPGWVLPGGTAFTISDSSTLDGRTFLHDSLVVTDGTPGGTSRLDILGDDFDARDAGRLNEFLLVAGQHETSPEDLASLWITDGTTAGTRQLVQDAALAVSRCGFHQMGEQALFFAGREVASDLWRTDGTAEGTTRFLTEAGPEYCLFDEPEIFDGSLYYYGADDHIWRTDGTSEGTELFFQISTDTELDLDQMAVAGGFLFFTVDKGTNHGVELWRTDGTTAGTLKLTVLKELGFSDLWYLTPLGDRLIFRAAPKETGAELWVSDGTVEGTMALSDLVPGALGSNPQHLVRLEGRVYYSAWDRQHGTELWSTDGTQEGTHLVLDLAPGLASSNPLQLRTIGEFLYFSAAEGTAGAELWRSDGSAAGTRRLTDLAPGARSSNAHAIAVAGENLLLSATDGSTGFEPWALGPEALVSACTTSGTDLCLGDGRFRVRVRWHNQRTGEVGDGKALPFSDRSGLFWFFNPSNVELVVKVLDGSSVNGFYWTFYGGLSDVEYQVEVTDLETGEQRVYRNPPGEICGVGDTASIPAGKSGARWGALDVPFAEPKLGSSVTGACTPDSRTLCLRDGRFAVVVDWRNGNTGATGTGGAIPGTDQSGYFWFFNPANVEMVVKVLDGRPVNGSFWVFFGALSNVEFTLKVTDTETGAQRTYFNPQGEICGQADTGAFP
jgi:ELWxxDGT repeat protein